MALWATSFLLTCWPSAYAKAQIVTRDLYTLTLPPDLTHYQVFAGHQAAAGGQVVGFCGAFSDSNARALVWNGTDLATNLTPTGNTFADASATDGVHQVGFGSGPSTGNVNHPFYWAGTPGSMIDLMPTNLSGIISATAVGIGGDQIVGVGSDANNHHIALLWDAPSAVAIDLNPSQIGVVDAVTMATDGKQQVGYTWSFDNSQDYALLWSGSAASAVSLHPSGFSLTHANGVSNGQQVGWGRGSATGNQGHALIWYGTANSVVDINPDPYTFSNAVATNGTWQAGWADGPLTGGIDHAMAWNGSAASAVDLQALLPPGYTESEALSIDSSGNIYGVAFDSAGNEHAIEWTVPEPASRWTILGLAALTLLLRSRQSSIFNGLA
ncbi:MAG TPA: hypothetical protein VK797_13785 [Tepidisphaeraceae bacterium]|nr:hypothetical protein [Tepidisphaeraceae bacterium]